MMYKNKAKTGMEKLEAAANAQRKEWKAMQEAGQVMNIEVSPEQYEIFRACTDTGQDMILNVRRRGLIPNFKQRDNSHAKPFLGKVILMIQ